MEKVFNIMPMDQNIRDSLFRVRKMIVMEYILGVMEKFIKGNSEMVICKVMEGYLCQIIKVNILVNFLKILWLAMAQLKLKQVFIMDHFRMALCMDMVHFNGMIKKPIRDNFQTENFTELEQFIFQMGKPYKEYGIMDKIYK